MRRVESQSHGKVKRDGAGLVDLTLVDNADFTCAFGDVDRSRRVHGHPIHDEQSRAESRAAVAARPVKIVRSGDQRDNAARDRTNAAVTVVVDDEPALAVLKSRGSGQPRGLRRTTIAGRPVRGARERLNILRGVDQAHPESGVLRHQQSAILIQRHAHGPAQGRFVGGASVASVPPNSGARIRGDLVRAQVDLADADIDRQTIALHQVEQIAGRIHRQTVGTAELSGQRRSAFARRPAGATLARYDMHQASGVEFTDHAVAVIDHEHVSVRVQLHVLRVTKRRLQRRSSIRAVSQRAGAYNGGNRQLGEI